MNGEVTVREAMTPEFVGVSEGDDIVDAAELLLAEDVPGAVVLRGNEPVGMLTGRDVMQWVVDSTEGAEATVKAGMRDGVPSISANRSVEDAAAEMFARSTSQLLVVDGDDDLQGVLTKGDIVAATALGPSEQAPVVDSVQHESERTAAVHENLKAAAGSAGDGTFSEQGICERCGALAAELTTTNGELLCSDCRDV